MTDYTIVQSGSFWNATGTFPAGVYTVQGCAEVCKTFPGIIGFNSDAVGSAVGGCYCTVPADLNFDLTAAAFTSYVFADPATACSSAAASGRGETRNYNLLVFLLVLLLFTLLFRK
jgi:hypothetical protein